MGPIHSSFSRGIALCLACLLSTSFARADAQSSQETPLYKQANAPIESRLTDLVQRGLGFGDLLVEGASAGADAGAGLPDVLAHGGEQVAGL